MPMLADAYGLYYNKELLAGGRVHRRRRRRLDELETMAMKLTTFNADGSIKTLGFNPMMGWYENARRALRRSRGATWLKDDGTSSDRQRPGLGRGA